MFASRRTGKTGLFRPDGTYISGDIYAAKEKTVTLANGQEGRIRHFHHLLMERLSKPWRALRALCVKLTNRDVGGRSGI
ncbi:MAG: hypothetical protein ACREQF_01235 [Candidatus Binataceae bacterium]